MDGETRQQADSQVTQEQLLRDCEALNRKGEITYAALVLFGTHEALGEFLANSETIFEYRANEAAGPAFSPEDFRLVRCVMDGKQMPKALNSRIARLVDLGVLERVDRRRFVVAQKYYQAIGQSGKYTRLRGISDKASMELLCQHMRNENNRGLHLIEFAQVLPAFSPRKIQRLLNVLAKKGKARIAGKTKGAKWYLIDSGLTVN